MPDAQPCRSSSNFLKFHNALSAWLTHTTAGLCAVDATDTTPCSHEQTFGKEVLYAHMLCCAVLCRPINDSTEPVEALGPFEVVDADTIREWLELWVALCWHALPAQCIFCCGLKGQMLYIRRQGSLPI